MKTFFLFLFFFRLHLILGKEAILFEEESHKVNFGARKFWNSKFGPWLKKVGHFWFRICRFVQSVWPVGVGRVAVRPGCHHFGVTPFHNVLVMKTFCFNLLGLNPHTQRKATVFGEDLFFFFWSSLSTNFSNRGWHHEGCVTHTGLHHALPAPGVTILSNASECDYFLLRAFALRICPVKSVKYAWP